MAEETWFDSYVRVRYQETDQMGVVYHANYLVWFEVGRTELIRQLGFSYQRFEGLGFMLPVTEAHASYKKAARYDDELIIRTKIARLEGVRLVFAYEIIRQNDGELLASGETHHIWTSLSLKPVRLERQQPELYAMLKQYES
ncbi:thioesterase family protein [Aneurinibacillus sp. Ricciae_BoGa-3]|uniref:acyl-CoA thioesterase n=1 Tax=Aneurinibacillus sp. Ricciae_BoGa-3 TaxID=3022697 RepID=UPI0023407CD8|nr:thioesterase family protein [Aneurinibacillus sp. Ricciae_BoGa-3]WCK55512.1 thioesterase family protein [Aneurinibacillus sp. Ricciae_BoGa-3]